MRALAVALLSLCGVFPSIAQSPVPVSNEPRHHVKFENDYVEYKPGDFRWRAAPVTHSIKNIGSTRFEAVGVDWK